MYTHQEDFERGSRGHCGRHHGRGEGRGDFADARGGRGHWFAGWRERPFDREGRHGFGGRGFGRGGERMFDAGDVRLVVLKLLAEQPSYGYQLIKTMEERLGGGYTPSAGVIYPTLTMLEEEGLASVSTSDSKKVYSVTPEGQQYLEANKERIQQLFARLDVAGRGFRRGRSPEIMRAFMNLRGAISMRLHRENVTDEQIRKISEAINAAAKAIDEL
ncbi:MAG TPA: PadR family transcriptional regulator [Bryocella sp.]|nr:PadR family transcriptional regulator [Bryocella sp.]